VKAERLGLGVVIDEVAEALGAIEFGTAAPRCRTFDLLPTILAPQERKSNAGRTATITGSATIVRLPKKVSGN
jgi:hypothetical protein